MNTPREKHGQAIGLLQPLVAPAVRLSRYYPSDDLAPFVDFYWIVRWALGPDESRRQETLPHPCVHLVVERNASGLFGVVQGRFTREIHGSGRAASVRFRPGGFAAFWRGSVRELTARVLSLGEAFGAAGVAYEQALLGAPDDDAAIVTRAEAFLRARNPREDASLGLLSRAMSLMEQDHRITRVNELAQALGIGVRALQRLFVERVGVSPKWAINRARLQNVAARVMAGEVLDWTRLALELGYFDQAHLIRAYRKIIGVPPGEHARRTRETGMNAT